MPTSGYVWTLKSPREALVREAQTWSDPEPGWVLVEVLGCGVCHTDLGYADGDVAPKAKVPLVLGHEIVGKVIAANLPAGSGPSVAAGARVLVPAVTPCGGCAVCARGRPTACARGYMPGNDGHGGFATHALVPARSLLALETAERTGVDKLGALGLEPWELAPIADAATTAYQAIVRAGLRRDDVAVFVGAGGVGGFGVQFARGMGARTLAVDVSEARLRVLEPMVDKVLDTRGLEPRAIRDAVRSSIRAAGWSERPVRVFETSGTPEGQSVAFDLLERGGSLSIVGFTPARVNLRLSNIMALDAEVYGNWGCDPALFPEAVAQVLDGRVQVRPFIQRFPLDEVNAVLGAMRAHTLSKRAVLVPNSHGGSNV